MSKAEKAEQRALEAYPVLFSERRGYDNTFKDRRESYIKGYHQAEKDLELTWEDIKEIYFLFKTVKNEWYGHEFSDYGICREVLKRFKAKKGK